ncbi:ABC transporter ATP-binding protein [Pedobacter lusitanus]|uniref:ABC transporter ATP-binding protein n=1 Tax=Pedobacter lusitanus TaxID=1503925 RepID=A0A0D0GVU2_9SPHI|nr:glycine betaine/L-proline ABC transporter ATP-binding protein [Pedobacter lusitanus]KIO78571.1 ABC transporter ATP-binding protein [Pedobacter lusitanus]
MSKLKIEDLTLIFGNEKEEALTLLKQGKSKAEILKKTGCTVAVKNASFNIEKGEFFVIMGLSGSGKSSLLRCLNRLIEPTSGNVILNDVNITSLGDKELQNVRKKEMAMVFQNFGLLPHRTVLENVAFGLELQNIPQKEREEKAQEVINMVSLKGYEHQNTAELSGGMQQRVGLARALANDPEILLMDEAFSALDPLIRTQMQDELIDLQEKMHKTIVFITHDLDEAIRLGDRIAIMKDGEVIQIGTPEDILTNPADDYVSSFVEKVDRKSIITAASLLFEKPTVAIFKKDGVEGSLRKMRSSGLTTLPAVSVDKHFLGFVYLKDILELKVKGHQTIEMAIVKDVPVAYPETTVEQMLPFIAENGRAVPIIDKDTNKLLGIVAQTSLLIETTGTSWENVNGNSIDNLQNEVI